MQIQLKVSLTFNLKKQKRLAMVRHVPKTRSVLITSLLYFLKN